MKALPGKKKYFALAILFILLFFINKKLALYLLFSGLTAAIVYYSKFYHIPFDVSPLFFFQLVITRYYGLPAMLLFVMISYLIPKTIAGHAGNWMSYAFLLVSITANIIVMGITGLSLQTAGFIASIIQYIGGIIVGKISKPLILAALDGIPNTLNNMVWLLIFSDLVVFLLS